ncbi:MAG: vitamin B12-dependent ribonucleotide reductase, partial [Acidimicrobiia bacterium]
VRFEPSGITKNPEVRFAKSIVDYVFRWMASKFLNRDAQFQAGVNQRDEATVPVSAQSSLASDGRRRAITSDDAQTSASFAAIQNQEDAPPCTICGSIMVRNGSCYKCVNCGSTSGCA